jgi:ATP-dependent Clp protease adaptor protein ClpS
MSVLELPRTSLPGEGVGGSWRVVVLNDDHNTFDHVAETLARVLPGVSLADGYRIADRVHNQGVAVVWSGPREDAQSYWILLDDAGLTLGPLEAG